MPPRRRVLVVVRFLLFPFSLFASMRSLRIFVGLAIWTTTLFLTVSAQSGCFFPNGVESERAYYGSCSKNAQDPLSKICCALNRQNPPGSDEALGEPQDECLPNGLCAYKAERAGTNITAYFRNLCTEKDWKSGKCLDVCTSGVC